MFIESGKEVSRVEGYVACRVQHENGQSVPNERGYTALAPSGLVNWLRPESDAERNATRQSRFTADS